MVEKNARAVPEKLWTSEDVAKYLSVSVRTVEEWRAVTAKTGELVGPEFRRIPLRPGSIRCMIRYRPQDVLAFGEPRHRTYDL